MLEKIAQHKFIGLGPGRCCCSCSSHEGVTRTVASENIVELWPSQNSAPTSDSKNVKYFNSKNSLFKRAWVTSLLLLLLLSTTSVTKCWNKMQQNCPKSKVAQLLQKHPKISQSSFYLKSDIFQNSPKIVNYLGYYCRKMCHQDLSKIAQSGHTVTTTYGCCYL